MPDIIESILTRRSIRKYTTRQIGDKDLNIILEAGKYAPSSGNSQSWHFTVLQNKEKLLQLNEHIKSAFENLEVGTCPPKTVPLVIRVLHNIHTQNREAKDEEGQVQRGTDHQYFERS